MNDENDILQTITDMIKPEYRNNSEIFIKNNMSSYNSIVVTSKKTAYRSSDTSELLFARLKMSGKSQYISIAEKYHTLFDSYGVAYSNKKSEIGFIRLGLDVFSPLSNEYKVLPDIFNKIFIDIFSFSAFGCCSKYVECSDAGHCIHDDLAYATACQYRKNLESGKIFYGNNKNLPTKEAI